MFDLEEEEKEKEIKRIESIPIEDFLAGISMEEIKNTCKRIEEFLCSHKDRAYSRYGIIKALGLRESPILKYDVRLGKYVYFGTFPKICSDKGFFSKRIKMKRITITLEDDVEKGIMEHIGRSLLEKHKDKTWTEAINELLRVALSLQKTESEFYGKK